MRRDPGDLIRAMTDVSTHDPHAAESTERLVGRLTGRYLGVLAAIGLLVVLDQVALQPLLARLNGFAPVINLAGRQRMLSQRITKSVLAIAFLPAADDEEQQRVELARDIEAWSRVHRGLIDGDSALHLPPLRSVEIRTAFDRMAPVYQRMRELALRVARSSPRTDDSVSEEARVDLRGILVAEAGYLRQMDHIVDLFEREARGQIAQLRLLGFSIAGIIIVLLVGMGRFVLRPAVVTIRHQFHELIENRRALAESHDQLERRVQERTRRLHAANEALRAEFAERQRIEEEARRVLNQLAHLSRVRATGQLAAGLAHELNQPLTTITCSAETAELLLERETLDQKLLSRSIEAIRGSALRAGAIIRRIRNFVQPTERLRGKTEINELVLEIAELCGPECRRAGVTVAFDLQTNPRTTVHADPIQVQQVLVNLVHNAVQAIDAAGCAERRVTIRTRQAEAIVELEVDDTGPGFAEAELDSAFRSFYTTRPDGLGLGLAISRSIVHDHGGELWIVPKPDGGARVIFTLPCHPPEAARDLEPADCIRD